MEVRVGRKGIDIKGALNVYCGRGSAFGNPFVMRDKSQAERQRVCAEFARYFQQEMAQADSPLRAAMCQLVRDSRPYALVNLQCFCAPLQCHCETIAASLVKARAWVDSK